MLREYEYHAESKCADAQGRPAGKQTVGLLARRHVAIERLRFIGKESNALEEVEGSMAPARGSPYTEYPDPQRDEWATKILPILKAMPMGELQRLSGLSRSTLQAIRAGRVPHPRNRAVLLAACTSI